MTKTALYFAVALGCALSACGKHLPASPDGDTYPVAQYGTPFTKVPDPKDVILYQVNIRAFSAKGDFAGVRARLDEIKSLGVNTLYLLPIYPVGELKSVNSPYCVKDYKAVNSEFGTLEELRELVAEAHRRNMAVLFDWVADHTSLDNAWISHKSWYKQDAAGNIISPPKTGWYDVAALNYDNQEMRAAMIDAMKFWVYQTNIDGYRCDAADFIPFDFWRQAIDSLRAIKTHRLLFFAEGTRRDQFEAGFQLVYGMGFYNNMVNSIYGKHQTVRSIDSLNTLEYKKSTPDDQVVRYTSNHDVDQSDGTPLDLLGGKEGSLAAFVVAAYMKGVPMIYGGQEVGCSVKLSFFDHRTPIDWTRNPDMVAEYKKIIGLRNRSEAIKQGELHSYDTDDVCVFTKKFGAEEVLVMVNLRNAAVPFEMPPALADPSWKDAFGNDADRPPGTVDLRPYQYRVWQK